MTFVSSLILVILGLCYIRNFFWVSLFSYIITSIVPFTLNQLH
jgi:hypothetical protein